MDYLPEKACRPESVLVQMKDLLVHARLLPRVVNEALNRLFDSALINYFHNMTIQGVAVDNKKQTMYEVLEISPTASFAEIRAAHKRQSLNIMSGALGLSREEFEFKLKVLDVALHTLSSPVLRDAYDAELAANAAPGNAVVPVRTNVVSSGDETRALQLMAAMEGNYKAALQGFDEHRPALQVVSSTVSTSVKSLKTIVRGVIGLLVLGSILTVGRIAFGSRQDPLPPKEVAQADEKLMILEYYKKYGVRPASRAEAEFLETENRRKENEQRAAAFEEKKRADEFQRFEEESRRMGDNIHDTLVRDEEREMQKQRRLAEEKQAQEEAAKEEERMRIENERRRYGLK